MRSIRALGVMASAFVTLQASADVLTIFASGFEPSEGYTPGRLAGQQGWFTFLNESPDFGEVVAASPISGSQSVLLDGRRVELGTFDNYAAVGLLAPIPATHNGLPLTMIEITGRAMIVDPTLTNQAHFSAGNFALYDASGAFCTNLGPNSEYSQLTFGWELPNALPVQAGVAFEFLHRADYTTGLASQWMNGEIVYANFPEAFNASVIPDEIYFDMFAFDLLPFDTQVWYDDIHVKAIYIPAPGALWLAGAMACLARCDRRPGRISTSSSRRRCRSTAR